MQQEGHTFFCAGGGHLRWQERVQRCRYVAVSRGHAIGMGTSARGAATMAFLIENVLIGNDEDTGCIVMPKSLFLQKHPEAELYAVLLLLHLFSPYAKEWHSGGWTFLACTDPAPYWLKVRALCLWLLLQQNFALGPPTAIYAEPERITLSWCESGHPKYTFSVAETTLTCRYDEHPSNITESFPWAIPWEEIEALCRGREENEERRPYGRTDESSALGA